MQFDGGAGHVMRTTRFGEGVVCGIRHLQRREDVLLGVQVEGLAGEGFDQGAERDEVDIGVGKVRAGCCFECRVHGTADAFGFVGSGQSPRIFQVHIRWQAGVVG
jgi:hypothetical protein